MKLSEFMNNLNQLILETPEALDYDVVTAKDDEGNGFNLVHFTPTIGLYDAEDYFSQFTAEESFEENEIEGKPNAICVN